MRFNLPYLRRQANDVKHALIVGANGRAEHLVKEIAAKGLPGCRIEVFVDDDLDRRAALEELGVPYLGPISVLERLMLDQVIDCVYVCLPMRSSYDRAQSVVDLCEEAGVPVFLMADFLPMHTESDDLWRMESQNVAELQEPPREELAPVPQADSVTPAFSALSAAFDGLVSMKPAFPRQPGGGHPRPPFSV